MEATLDQIRTVICEVFQEHGLEPDQILLFGSRARGTAGPYSDWDVLIVTFEALTVPQKMQLSREIRRRLAAELLDVDVLIFSQQEVARLKEVPGTVVQAVFTEGNVLKL